MSPLLIKSGFGEGFEMIVSGGAAASGAAHRGVGDWAVMYVPRWAGAVRVEWTGASDV